MNDYEARKQARIDRYRERAERARQRSQQRQAASDAAVEGIPPGQPILVGHHSERAHRRALDRSHQNMRQAIEEPTFRREKVNKKTIMKYPQRHGYNKDRI